MSNCGTSWSSRVCLGWMGIALLPLSTLSFNSAQAASDLMPTLQFRDTIVAERGEHTLLKGREPRDVYLGLTNEGHYPITVNVQGDGDYGQKVITLKEGETLSRGFGRARTITYTCENACKIGFNMVYAQVVEGLDFETLNWIPSQTCVPSNDCGADGAPCHRVLSPATTTVLHGADGDDAPLHVPSDFRVKRCNSQVDAYCEGGNANAVSVFVDRNGQNLFQQTLSLNSSSDTGTQTVGSHTRFAIRCNSPTSSCHVVWQLCHHPGPWIAAPQ